MATRAVAHPGATGRAALDVESAASINGWWRRFRDRLRDRRFWFVQAMVLAVSGGHAATELLGVVNAPHLEAIYFVPASLYFFPILYASLNFGREGAIPTAIWSTILAIPNIVLWHHGLERLGEAIQMTLMIFLACIVAWRVDKEVAARLRAEAMERSRALSEVKYRALFEAAAEPILVLDDSGAIEEANAAAAELLGYPTESLRDRPLAEVLGGQAADVLGQALDSPRGERRELHLRRPDGSDIWLEPLFTFIPGTGGEMLAQIMLKDVTERRGFQRYAREITRAQEEERQRIAQELHDVSVQSAIMICRRLDAAALAVDEGGAEAVTRTLAEARHTAETMADELRRFSRDLRPLTLDDLGLVPALKRLLVELRERSGIDTRFDVVGSIRRLDPSVELATFRIAQEALRNVETHANASQVTVGIDFGATTAVLTVQDDGSGFHVPSLPALVGAGHLGLLGIRERAQLIHGSCEIRSVLGTGTTVVATVPVDVWSVGETT